VRRIKAYDQQPQILLSESCVRQFAETSEKILLLRGPEGMVCRAPAKRAD
jgi:hypothetical protein